MLNWMLLAQDFSFETSRQADIGSGGVVVFVLVAFAITVLVIEAVYAAMAFPVYLCYKRIPAEHRQMEPGQVWLLLIPLFNLVWSFFVFPRLAKSFESYFAAQGRTDVGDCGAQLGLWFAICGATLVIPCVNYVSWIPTVVLYILFIVKALGLKNQIPEQAM